MGSAFCKNLFTDHELSHKNNLEMNYSGRWALNNFFFFFFLLLRHKDLLLQVVSNDQWFWNWFSFPASGSCHTCLSWLHKYANLVVDLSCVLSTLCFKVCFIFIRLLYSTVLSLGRTSLDVSSGVVSRSHSYQLFKEFLLCSFFSSSFLITNILFRKCELGLRHIRVLCSRNNISLSFYEYFFIWFICAVLLLYRL